MNKELIAPCGMDCAICSAYLAKKNNLRDRGIKRSYCDGCRPEDKKCAFLKKQCRLLLNKKIEFCFECKKFPCKNLKSIDKRYRERYHMSMIENLKNIEEKGIDKFLKSELKKWKCKKCTELICCHNGLCFKCDIKKLIKKKKRYSWEE